MGITIKEAIKELRQITSAGIMDCKKALVKSKGDIAKAVEQMRKTGVADLNKKILGRKAKQGQILISVSEKRAVMLEINSETDFVSRHEEFKNFSSQVIQQVLESKAENIEQVLNLNLNNSTTIQDECESLVKKFGENIVISRIATINQKGTSFYNHDGRIGVLVLLEEENISLGKDIAMHIAAMDPISIFQNEIPEDIISREKEVLKEQLINTKKNIKPKIFNTIMEGKIKKFINEKSLMGQNFVKNPKKTISDFLQEENAKVVKYVCFRLGEDRN